MKKRVSIVQRVLPHYRVEFFDRLKDVLDDRGIDLQIIYGKEKPGTIPKSVEYDREWSVKTEIQYRSLGPVEIVAQRCRALLADSDMIVIEQANRLLLNYRLIFSRHFFSNYRLAFWGHGRNFQSKRPGSFFDRLKNFQVGRVDWWFAYTAASTAVVKATGFPEGRITTVGNTIDTSEFRQEMINKRAERMPAPSQNQDTIACLFCGGMYRDKKIDFLIDSLAVVRDLVPNFEMIFVGAGPESGVVERAANSHPWIHYVGSKIGNERAPYFARSKALLIPGAVGLAVIDSFAAGIPLITVAGNAHGPELDYLTNGVNGLIVEDDVEVYGRAIAEVLLSEELQKKYKIACEQSANELTMEKMVSNFAEGVSLCLVD